MADRVPITLFVNVGSVTAYASWSDPLNPSDPWTGYPYQWTVSFQVRPQPHSDPSTPRPFTYNGLDISVGDWLIFSSAALALQIVSVTSQTDSSLTVIAEDVSLYNILSDPSQTGQGIGPISPHDVFDCLVVKTSPAGIPIFSTISDYSIPINLISDITNRFQFRNYVQDYIAAVQPGHDFLIGDVIYIDQDGVYRKSISTDPGAEVSIGTVTSIDQPNIGDFTYRPIGRYVTNLPALPGNPGQVLYVSSTVPGGLTPVPPSPVAIPVYIKISNTSGILTSGGGGGGGAAGNISIIGNTILATNTNGNINLQPNGNGTVNSPSANITNLVADTGRFTSLTPGRVVVVGPDGSLVDTGYFTFDIPSTALSVGNVKISSDFITTTDSGIPLVLTTSGNANVKVAATLDLDGNRIVNVQDPLQDQDVATKSYVDAVATGLSTKEAVHVATGLPLNATYTPSVAYGSLTANVYERLIIDDIEPGINSRILVKNQIDERENGIYRVVQIGSPGEPWLLSRTTDFNGQGVAGEIRSGDFVFVEVGTAYGGTGWVMTSPNPVTVNVSDIRWTQFSAAGVIQAGFGITKTGTVLDVNVAAIIDKNTGLNATPGPTGNKIIEIHLSSTTPLEFDQGALQVKSSIAGSGLSYNPVAGNIRINSDQPTVSGLGNIISGTWSAGVISTQYGGTGLSVIGLPAQVLVVNNSGTALEYDYRSKLTEGNIPPYFPQPADGDKWFNTDTGIMFTRITDDTGSHWVEL